VSENKIESIRYFEIETQKSVKFIDACGIMPGNEFLKTDTVIGYLKLNFGESQTELKGDKALEIERIYVLKEFHGKKVGQLLYDKAIQVATETKADYVWLGVWEENPRAIAFYKKNGFVEFDKHIFRLGDEEQTDIMMKLQLKS